MANKTIVTAEPGKLEVMITREFDAPRELVFKAFTNPDLFAQWWGKRDHTLTLKAFQPHDGGSWHAIATDQHGNAYGFHGVFHAVTAPEYIIQTIEFDGLPEKGHVGLGTARFEALPGNRTRVTSQSIAQSVSDRDMVIQSGMEEGANESYDRLQELLDKSN